MSSPTPPFNVMAEVKALKHEKQNQDLRRLPPNATIQRRPLNHAPISDLRTSGDRTPKVVYVSRRTPAIAAIKRVKKFLVDIEKRALQNAGATVTKKGGSDPIEAIHQTNQALAQSKEEVLVKASGRAMAQALRVGEWFRTKEKDMLCHVEVRTGSVSTVDDIVEGEVDGSVDKEMVDEDEDAAEETSHAQGPSMIQCGDTTLDLMGGVDVAAMSSSEQAQSTSKSNAGAENGQSVKTNEMEAPFVKQSRRKRKKQRRRLYEAGELPEARLRWIKTVEVAISLAA